MDWMTPALVEQRQSTLRQEADRHRLGRIARRGRFGRRGRTGPAEAGTDPGTA